MEQKNTKKSFKAPFSQPKHLQCVQTKSQSPIVVGKSKKTAVLKKSTSKSDVSIKHNTNKKPTVALSDADYEDIFSSVMARTAAEENSGSISGSDQNIAEVAAIPDPNEAFRPSEATEAAQEFNKQTITTKDYTSTKAAHKTENNDHNYQRKKSSSQTNGTTKNGSTFSTPAKRKHPEVSEEEEHVKGSPEKISSKATSKEVTNNQIPHDDKMCKSKNKLIKPTSRVQPAKKVCNVTEAKMVTKKKTPQSSKCITSEDKSHTSESLHTQSTVSTSLPTQESTTSKKQSQQVKPSGFGSVHSQISGSSNNITSQSKKHSRHAPSVSLHPSQGSVVRQASQSQRSEISLSQPAKHLDTRQRLEWLQTRRDVGVWVQCGRQTCSKWRYLANVKDPVDVPQHWYCYMNPDLQYNHCSAPEKGPTPLEEEDLIHNLYTAGSVVWGRLCGYPWWPALVDDDPDVEQYYWLNGFSDIPTHYNVVFFDDKEVTRAWLTPGAMRSFTGTENRKEYRTVMYHGVNYEKRLLVAKQQAIEAHNMTIKERLLKFSFLARYKGPIGKRKKKNVRSEVAQHTTEEEIISLCDMNSETDCQFEELNQDTGKSSKKNMKKRSSSVKHNSTVKKAKSPTPFKAKQITNSHNSMKKSSNGNKKDEINTYSSKDKESDPHMKNNVNDSVFTQEVIKKKSKKSHQQKQQCIVPVFSKSSKKNTPSTQSPRKVASHYDSEDSETNFSKYSSDLENISNHENNMLVINQSQDIFDEDDTNYNKQKKLGHTENEVTSVNQTSSCNYSREGVEVICNQITSNYDKNSTETLDDLDVINKEVCLENYSNVVSQMRQGAENHGQTCTEITESETSTDKNGMKGTEPSRKSNLKSSSETSNGINSGSKSDNIIANNASGISVRENSSIGATVWNKESRNVDSGVDLDLIDSSQDNNKSNLKNLSGSSNKFKSNNITTLTKETPNIINGSDSATASGIESNNIITNPSCSAPLVHLQQPSTSSQAVRPCCSGNSDAVVPQIELQLDDITYNDENYSSDFEPEE